MKSFKQFLIENPPAWHGSQHNHDGFSIDKVGTGEGNQAYGWGLYFASNRGVAEWYKAVLAKRVFTYKGEGIPATISELDHPLAILAKEFLGTDRYLLPTLNDALADISELDRYEIESRVDNDDYQPTRQKAAKLALHLLDHGVEAYKQGTLYHVDIKPTEDEMLDWDTPFEEQSDNIKHLIQVRIDKLEASQKSRRDKYTHEEYLKFLMGDKSTFEDDNSDTVNESNEISKLEKMKSAKSGKDLYYNLARTFNKSSYSNAVQRGSDKAASLYLLSIGIRGIKYLDGNSRFKGKGYYNYVIFNDKDVTIKEKI